MKKIKIGSDFSGVGAFNQALKRMGVDHEEVFACDMDKYSRITFITNYGTESDKEILKTENYIFVANVFHRIFVEPKSKQPIQEDVDKAYQMCESISRSFSFYYPWNVYNRETPKENIDLYMTSPPCQSFSLAGKRLGKEDKRGILFFNSHEFIEKNKPRFFIFENVEGLLSDDNGKTFKEWEMMLGGKSVNGNPVIFPYENAVPYHIYYKVVNAKDHGIPQNRKRIFIVGIRDDEDNVFNWAKEEFLHKRLKDILEDNVSEKYFLSEKMMNYFNERTKNFNNGKVNYKDEGSVLSTITSSQKSIDISDNIIKIGNTNPSGNGMNGNVFSDQGIAPTLSTNKGEGIKVQIKSNTKKGFDIATENDSINFSNPNSKTRRGRVGVVQTLDTSCNQGVIVGTWRTHKSGEGFRKTSDNAVPTITSRSREDGSGQAVVKIPIQKAEVIQMNDSNESNGCQPFQQNRVYSYEGISPTLDTEASRKNFHVGYRIRRLTPRECFNAMDFPGTFDFSHVSDSQAYRQAGNSICVGVLVGIINGMKHLQK